MTFRINHICTKFCMPDMVVFISLHYFLIFLCREVNTKLFTITWQRKFQSCVKNSFLPTSPLPLPHSPSPPPKKKKINSTKPLHSAGALDASFAPVLMHHTEGNWSTNLFSTELFIKLAFELLYYII